MSSKSIFQVDHVGMRQVYRSRGLHRMLGELVSNAFDEPVCHVSVNVTIDGRVVTVEVIDDSPEGFKRLEEAYTLFSPSKKQDVALLRGRFNFGEKWVLACMDQALVESTTGSVHFDMHVGKRTRMRASRAVGTRVWGTLRGTHAEVQHAIAWLRTLLVPGGVYLHVNGALLAPVDIASTFEATLPTVSKRNSEDGELVRTERKAVVVLHCVRPGERPTIYELGIPVVSLDPEDGDPFHIDVRQKIPLSVDRNSVSPGYLKRLRALVVTHTANQLTAEQATARAITAGLADADSAAVATVIAKRFGEKRAVYDPSDREANNRLAAEGYTIIPAASFDKETWSSIRIAQAAIPSGTLRPTPQPYSEGGNPVRVLTPDELTDGMLRFTLYAQLLARYVCGCALHVRYVDTHNNFSMCCGKGGNLDVNVRRLGRAWFDLPFATRWEVDDILLDEFGHLREENHLSDAYYCALREFGAKIGVLKLTRPELFVGFQ